MLCCLNPSLDRTEYFNMSAENGISEALLSVREVFWEKLRSFPFRYVGISYMFVCILSAFHSVVDAVDGKFAHLGTLSEYLDIATRESVFRPSLGLSNVFVVFF